MKAFPYYRSRFIYFYLICISLFILWLYFNGLLLSQLKPVLFVNRLDLSLNLINATGLTALVIKSNSLKILLDVLFIFLPLLLLVTNHFHWKLKMILPVLLSLFIWMYSLILSSMSSLSVEGFAAFTLIPLLFITDKETNYYFLFNCLRYAFIILFFSTALWKFRGGGIYNIEQMSGILINQHSTLLAENADNFFTNLIKYLISHPAISWLLFAAGVFIEFFFVTGLFTKKLDRLLLVLLISFFLLDYFLMHINYLAWLPFAGLLYFSRYTSLSLQEQHKYFSNTLAR